MELRLQLKINEKTTTEHTKQPQKQTKMKQLKPQQKQTKHDKH